MTTPEAGANGQHSHTDAARGRGNDGVSLAMLAIIMAALVIIFIVGMALMVAFSETRKSESIVAVLSPVLGVVSAIAAGVFGYKEGSKGVGEANEGTRRASEALAESKLRGLVENTVASKIANNALAGRDASVEDLRPGMKLVSKDDLDTLKSAVDNFAAILGAR